MGDDSPERWRRILEILDGAISLPPGERSEYLRAACGEDAELHRAVEELLDASDRAGDFLDQPFHSQAGRMLREVAGLFRANSGIARLGFLALPHDPLPGGLS